MTLISKKVISMFTMISNRNDEKDPLDDHSILMRTNYLKAKKLKIIAAQNDMSLSVLLNTLADAIIEDWEHKNGNKTE